MTIDPIQYPASLAPTMPDDPRQERWAEERRHNGFDNTELWNLDATFARLMLPRILAYIDHTREKVLRDDTWGDDMAAIIAMMQIVAADDKVWNADAAETIEKGLDAFRTRIMSMWY